MTNEHHAPDRTAQRGPPAATISRADLALLAAVSTARFSAPDAEAERASRVIAVHQAGQVLASQLTRSTRHAISESRGSHCTWDVSADLLAAYDALLAYAAEVRGIAARYTYASADGEGARREADVRTPDRRLHAI